MLGSVVERRKTDLFCQEHETKTNSESPTRNPRD